MYDLMVTLIHKTTTHLHSLIRNLYGLALNVNDTTARISLFVLRGIEKFQGKKNKSIVLTLITIFN